MSLEHCQPGANHNPGECNICDYYENSTVRFPHCDAYVLHSIGSCTYCDEYAAEAQQWREDNNVNYTGENDPNKAPCPATTRRKLATIHAWHGNYPAPPSCKKCGKVAVYINLALACPDHGAI